MIERAISALCPVTQLLQLSNVITTYIIFDRQLVQCAVLSFHVNGFAPSLQNMSLEYVAVTLTDQIGVDPEAYFRASGQDSTFCYIVYMLFDMLYEAIGNKVLYEVGTNWIDLNKFQGPETMTLSR